MELNILLYIHSHFQCGFLDFIMPAISFLSNGGWIWIATAVILLFFNKYRRYGIALAIGLIFCLLIGNIALKPLIARTRPYDVYTGIDLIVAKLSDFSFPSGHTYSAFCGATVLFHMNKKLGYGAFALAVVTAFSRMYLFVHYPTDVLAGVVMGVSLALFSLYLVKVYERRVQYKKLESKI